MSNSFRFPERTPSPNRLARDSLELGSLASSSSSLRNSVPSSASGVPSSRKLSVDNEDHVRTPRSPRTPRRPNRNRTGSRSYSISSAFDFAASLFPLSSSTHGYTALSHPTDAAINGSLNLDGVTLEKHKSLTYLNGLSLVVGLIIGSGIFSSPSQVNANAGSPGASLMVWAIAGTLAWTGAASYAELGGAIPLNGGAQTYLARIFGATTGFLYSWCTVSVIKPGSAAIITIIFGEYVVRAVIGADAVDVSPFINKAVAMIGLTLVTIINCLSTKAAARSANIFLFVKFLALLAISIIGIIVAITGYSWRGHASVDWRTKGWFDGTTTDLSRWAVALYAGLWAFDGWDNVNFVAGEFSNASRDLPRVIHTSMPLVILAYLLANIAYFLVLPNVVTSSSTTIAVAFGSQVFGPVGSLLLALMVSGSCFGAMNATIFTSGRLFYAAAKEGYLPSVFGRLGLWRQSPMRLSSGPGSALPKRRFGNLMTKLFADDSTDAFFMTPIPAFLLNFVLTGLYVAIGTFRTLLTFYGVAGYFFYFLTVLGLLVLRVKEPNLERPYRCWITTPIIFCCVSLFLISRSVVAEPWTSAAVVAFVIVGSAVGFWKVKFQSAETRGAFNDINWRFWRRRGRQ